LQELTITLDQAKRLYGTLPELDRTKEKSLSRRILSGRRGDDLNDLILGEVDWADFERFVNYDSSAAILSELYHHKNSGLQWLKDRLSTLGHSKEDNEKFFGDVYDILGFSQGDLIPRFQSGGKIPGYGGGDTVPVMAEKGEWIINKEASAKYNPILSAINNNTVGRFNQGGKVGYYAAGGRRVDNRELTDTEARSAFRKCVKDIFSTDFLLSK